MSLSQPSITVVGSYATGLTMKTERLPCSGETLLGSGYRVDFGGKGSNQAVGCSRLGARVSFVAKIGSDTLGEMALRLYSDEGIDTSLVLKCSDAPTGVGFIVVEASTGKNCIVLDPGANELLTASEVSCCAAAVHASVVLTQLEIPVEAAEAALAMGRASRATTILNPAPVRPLPSRVLQLVDVLTPNEVEARVLTGRTPESRATPEELGRELLRAGVKNVVMTLGENGALLVSEASARHFPALLMQAVDTTGAGDAFNAGLATALAWGATLEQAVELAVVTGGLAVTREGVIPSLPSATDLLECYRRNALPPPPWLASHAAAAL